MATYYVSTSGNDSAAGTSTGTAWKTFGTAVARIGAGDTLYVRGGTYTTTVNGGWLFYNPDGWSTGTSGNPILIKNYQDEVPILVGSGKCWDPRYFTMEGLRFTNNGNKTAISSHMITMRGGVRWKIRNCKFYEAATHSLLHINVGESGNDPQEFTIEYNDFWNVWQYESGGSNQDHCIYVSCDCRVNNVNSTIQRNTFRNTPNGRGIKIGPGSTSDESPHGGLNVLYNSFWRTVGPAPIQCSGNSNNVLIERNILFRDDRESDEYIIGHYDYSGNASTIVVKNNVWWAAPEFIEDNKFTNGGGNLNINPQYANPSAGDLHPNNPTAQAYGRYANETGGGGGGEEPPDPPDPPPAVGEATAVPWVRAVSGATTGASSSVSIDVPRDAATEAGDLMLMRMQFNGTGITPTLTGWTNIRIDQDSTNNRTSAWYYRFATTSGASSYTVSFATARQGVFHILTCIGVHATTPVDAQQHLANTTAATSANTPSATPVTLNTLAVFGIGTRGSITITPPAGMVEWAHDATSGASNNTTQLLGAEEVRTTAATGTRTFTFSGSETSLAQTLILRPVSPQTGSATVGSASAGADYRQHADKIRLWGPYRVPNCTIRSLHFRLAGGTAQQALRGVLYVSTAPGGEPTTFVKSSGQTAVAASAAAGYVKFSLQCEALDTEEYYIGLWLDSTANGAKIYFDESATYTEYYDTVAYSATNDPTFTSEGTWARQVSGYISYDPLDAETDIPIAPDQLTASAQELTITLAWRNNATNATAIRVSRATSSGGVYTVLTSSLDTGATTYTDSVSAGTYYYKVYALNGAEVSAASNIASATASDPPVNNLPAGNSAGIVSTGTRGGRLQLAILTEPDGVMLADWSAQATACVIATGEHGDESCRATVPLPMPDAFRFYAARVPWLRINDGAYTVWEGRIEDPALWAEMDSGLSVTALGGWRALTDVPYTALWSTTSVAEWRSITTDDRSSRNDTHFEFDTNNRLYITPRKDELMSSSHIGGLTYAAPSGGARTITAVSFSYSVFAPSGWKVEFLTWDATFTTATTQWSLSTTGSLQTGTQSLTFSGVERLEVNLYYNNATPAAYTGETGDTYVKITNLRVKTTAASTVTASAIASALASYVNGVNATFLRSSDALVQSPGLDLRDEQYEDEYPADILTRLAALGDSQTPPRRWEVGVRRRRLYLRPRGDAARTWYVDARRLEVQRSLEALVNSAYAVYQDASGTTTRGAVSTDSASVNRYGLTRRAAVEAQTTSSTQANVHRDAFLADHKQPLPRSSLTFSEVFDASGTRAPLYLVRAGDTIIIRNIPPALTNDIDRIRRFRLSRTECDLIAGTLTVEPELPLPALDVLVARREKGFRT